MEELSQYVQRTNILNQSVHRFNSVLSKRIFYIVESQIKKGFNLQLDFSGDYWIEVPIRFLGNYHFDDLNKATDGLQQCRFVFIDKEKEEFNKIIPFPNVKYQKGWGCIKVKVEKDALKFLAELSGGYTKYKLNSILSLNSAYGQRWYELCCQRYRGISTKWNNVTVEFIKSVFEVDDKKYNRNSDFLNWVVYKPIDEINKKTDLHISYEPIYGANRSITALNITIKKQLSKEEEEIQSEIEKGLSELLLLSDKDINNFILEMKSTYKWNEKLYNELWEYPGLLDELVKVHIKLKDGFLKPKLDHVKYMGGTVSKLILKYKRIQEKS